MKELNNVEVKDVNGGYLVLPLVAVYVWYEYGGGKEMMQQ